MALVHCSGGPNPDRARELVLSLGFTEVRQQFLFSSIAAILTNIGLQTPKPCLLPPFVKTGDEAQQRAFLCLLLLLSPSLNFCEEEGRLDTV